MKCKSEFLTKFVSKIAQIMCIQELKRNVNGFIGTVIIHLKCIKITKRNQ